MKYFLKLECVRVLRAKDMTIREFIEGLYLKIKTVNFYKIGKNDIDGMCRRL